MQDNQVYIRNLGYIMRHGSDILMMNPWYAEKFRLIEFIILLKIIIKISYFNGQFHVTNKCHL